MSGYQRWCNYLCIGARQEIHASIRVVSR